MRQTTAMQLTSRKTRATTARSTLRPEPLGRTSLRPVTGLPYIFDPAAFTAPLAGTYGNAPRAFARLFGRNQTNFNLTKNIYFNQEEGVRLQLRAEAFNVFNHTQFTGAGTTLTTKSTFGLPTGTRLPREFQFGAKLSF